MLPNRWTKSRFESIGIYLPKRVQSSTELMRRMSRRDLFDLEELTGVVNRRVRADSEDSYVLALEAARRCLSKSRYLPEELDVIIFASITRFKGGLKTQFDPAISLFLKRQLGATAARNFDITNACAGMCTGIHVLDTMIRSGAVKNGMVVSGECITPLSERAIEEITSADDQQVASLTVGDSGSACILEACSAREAGIDFSRFLTLGAFSNLCVALPSAEHPGINMYTRSGALHFEAIKRFPRFLEGALADHGMRLSDYDFLIPHQTSPSAMRAGSQALASFFKQAVPEVVSIVEDYGNTSSTSHLLALQTAVSERRIKQGDRVLFLVMASGLVLGLVSFTVSFLEASHGYENRHSQRLQPGWCGQID